MNPIIQKLYTLARQIGLTCVLALISFVFTTSASAAEFSLLPGNAEFVEGCESTVNIMLDTQGVDTNAADALVLFDPNDIEIIDQDPNQPGKQIREGNAYAVYAGNLANEGTGRIQMTAFNVFGAYNSNGTPGTFASIVFRGKPGVTNTDMTFEFTPGSTLDSNVADLNSDDVLTGVQNGSYTFRVSFCGNDTQPPRVNNPQPSPGSRNNALDSNITFNITDNLSGVDLTTLEVSVDGATFRNGDAGFSITGDPLDFDVTINPQTDFLADTPVFVEVDAVDIAGNRMNTFDWSFNHPVADNQPPFVQNPQPSPGSRNNPLDTNVSFRILDLISGVDINTVRVNIDGETYQNGDADFSVSGSPANFFIVIDPRNDFLPETGVNVSVDGTDQRGNIMNTFRWTFNNPLTDNQAPRVQSPNPPNGARQVDLDTNIQFKITDNIAGVDLDTLRITVDGVSYDNRSSRVSITGNKNDYDVVIDPVQDLTPEVLIEVSVDAADLRGNVMNTFIWRFNEPAVCGDNVVEEDFGEECEPAGVGCCNEECKIEIPEGVDVCEEIPEEEEEEFREVAQDQEQEAPCEQLYIDQGYTGIDDPDEDGLSNTQECLYLTSPLNRDTDGDGFSDGEEVLLFIFDPLTPEPAEAIEDLKITKLTNIKANMVTSDTTPTIQGYIKGATHAIVYATDQNEQTKELGRVIADERGVFSIESEIELEEGDYVIQAISYDSQFQEGIAKSLARKITIDLNRALQAPSIYSIGNYSFPESLDSQEEVNEYLRENEIVVYTTQPAVYGNTYYNSEVDATFQSIISKASLIADNPSGDFSIRSPESLEFGQHTLTIYATNAEGVRSEEVIIPFTIKPSLDQLIPLDWIFVIIVILLISAMIAEYRKEKREDIKKKKDGKKEDPKKDGDHNKEKNDEFDTDLTQS